MCQALVKDIKNSHSHRSYLVICCISTTVVSISRTNKDGYNVHNTERKNALTAKCQNDSSTVGMQPNNPNR